MKRFVIKRNGIEWFSTTGNDTMAYLIMNSVYNTDVNATVAVNKAVKHGECTLTNEITLYYEDAFIVNCDFNIGDIVFPLLQEVEDFGVDGVLHHGWYIGEEDEIIEIRPEIGISWDATKDLKNKLVFYKLRYCGKTLPASVLWKTEQDAFDYLKSHNITMNKEWLTKRKQVVVK